MHMYGCELWNLNYSNIEKFIIAWRKVKRRIWNLPALTHNTIVHNLTSDFNIILETRMIKFVYNSMNNNHVCKQLLASKLSCKNSCFADNYRFLTYKYKLNKSDWDNSLTFLMGKVKMKQITLYPCSLDASIVRELCMMRDHYTKEFNPNEFTLSELNCLLTDLCVN